MSDILRNFDKKNEIPKIKIPKFATGGICNDAIFPKIDAFSQIDEIVKDIRDRQDNAMAMEFTKCIEELLRKNSVVPKMTEYTSNFETENTFKTRYGVSIDELDFSEHDKVFEDKIAKLEKEVAEWKAEAREIKKNRDEQLKSFRKAVEPYVDILHMHETIAELKQRIAELESKNNQLTESILRKETKIHELESKEVEKPMRIEFHADNGEMLTPLEAANSLISRNIFKVDELKELAEFLQVYCRHHNDRDTETISF